VDREAPLGDHGVVHGEGDGTAYGTLEVAAHSSVEEEVHSYQRTGEADRNLVVCLALGQVEMASGAH
jgi:hypothetical protein